MIERIYENQNTTFSSTNKYNIPLSDLQRVKAGIKEIRENESISVNIFLNMFFKMDTFLFSD
jgi:hypothetical protein